IDSGEVKNVRKRQRSGNQPGEIDNGGIKKAAGKGKTLIPKQIAAPCVHPGVSARGQTIIGRSEGPINLGALRVGHNRPAERAALEIIKPGWRRGFERLEDVEGPIVIVHRGIASFVSAYYLVVVNPIRREPADRDCVISNEGADV